MAEFTEVVKQAKRMCAAQTRESDGSCHECPMFKVEDGRYVYLCGGIDPAEDNPRISSEEFERIVMEWAAEHPEPRYPTWNDWFTKTFPDSEYTQCPCPNTFYRICNPCAYHGEVECYDRFTSMAHVFCDEMPFEKIDKWRALFCSETKARLYVAWLNRKEAEKNGE